MNQGLSASMLPLALVQSLGLAVMLATYWVVGKPEGGRAGAVVASLGGALICYAPFVALAALLIFGPGRQIYAGVAALFIGLALFMGAVVMGRRGWGALSLGPMAAVAVWTFSLLAVMTSGL